MLAHGDTECVNLRTGERYTRVTGNGQSRLESEEPQRSNTMTWKEIADNIEIMSDAAKQKQATVFPPAACPSAEFVPVTELMFLNENQDAVLVTGKRPVKPHVLAGPENARQETRIGKLMANEPYKSGDNIILWTNKPDDFGRNCFTLKYPEAIKYQVEDYVNSGAMLTLVGEVEYEPIRYLADFLAASVDLKDPV